ncbi:double-strand break repair protein AddB [Yoonia sp. BS5-3]|uniref:Double-strand break repair protein AddB n=1 Tax=Yoonia phaeophyticola TaxID=3137369 RepID=A0ABZ2VAJ4_9RHOB
MFEESDHPRVFALPPGADFATGLVDGLLDRAGGLTPEMWARTEIYVNTTRMQRRIRSVFDAGPARLLPRIRLITDLASDPVSMGIAPAVSPLRRRLELSQFVAKLLEQEPDLAPQTALYDLSDSLANLMDEMQGEGVSPDAIAALDVTDQSGHWERALKFVNIIAPFFGDDAERPDLEARQRLVIEALTERWAATPPTHPIIVAGSTGSRGATALFMQAVAKLPQGAIILPGFDFDLPDAAWAAMADTKTSEDHPQYRFKRLMDRIDFGRQDVRNWSAAAEPHTARNALISLSLRPAPVTDQWLQDGPKLGNLEDATRGLTLIEASSPRAEAEAIALRLRQAAEDGITAALISPDRTLTRQVTAALDRWDIVPDDSAGTPLALSPPGRFLRHVGELIAKPLTSVLLLTVLKHPLCHSNRDDRGEHLRHTRELELYLRDRGIPFPSEEILMRWAKGNDARIKWATWLCVIIQAGAAKDIGPLHLLLDQHIALAEQLSAGPGADGTGGLWQEAAGREAKRICDELRQAADAAGSLSQHDYAALFNAIISSGTVRNRDAGHPGILIWGTLEARVHGVDLTILGGMNEGVWPEAPPPDPWLNRTMRAQAGLLLPERKIGLSAHDYQQAVAGSDVWITRAKRSADSETVPSRWINRLTNLLSGLAAQGGPDALEAMRSRGDHWLAMSAELSTPSTREEPSPRPAPCPPVIARPKRFSVTQIKTLIRDPYAIYARKILQLSPLEPLIPNANAPLRGTIVHGILETFIKENHDPLDHATFMKIARQQFQEHCPWPTIQAQWVAKLNAIAPKFLDAEAERQTLASDRVVEAAGKVTIPHLGMTLTCKADRIDKTNDGSAIIYDYKTGAVPTGPQQEKFDKQLLLEAAMLEKGGFDKIPATPVQDAAFIGVNAALKTVKAPLKKQPVAQVWAELETLFENWQVPSQGYTARLALFSKNDFGAYDHLSRFGEWDTSDTPYPMVLT